MAKRSRDISFSSSGDEAASDITGFSSDAVDLRTTKLVAYDTRFVPQHKHVMHCSLPPHSKSLQFSGLEEFETHYAKEHTNRCVECGKNLPSGHFLDLHLDENHNPLREALAAKGEKTYACFLLDCDKKCSTSQKRRLHLIDKHNFPKVYNFRIINEGIDHTNTLLQEGRRRRVSLINDESQSNRQHTTSTPKSADPDDQSVVTETSVTVPKIRTVATRIEPESVQGGSEPTKRLPIASPSISGSDVDDLEQSFAALRFVPRSVVSKQEKNRAQ